MILPFLFHASPSQLRNYHIIIIITIAVGVVSLKVLKVTYSASSIVTSSHVKYYSRIGVDWTDLDGTFCPKTASLSLISSIKK